MKKWYFIVSMSLNILLLLIVFLVGCDNSSLKHEMNWFRSCYLPKSMYDKAVDKILDYEWILVNIYKCKNPDEIRRYFCGR